jgi:hypothetical protein
MDSNKYDIVFKKLREAEGTDAGGDAEAAIEVHLDEFEEIDELRRLASALIDPDPTSYTTT